MKLLNERRLPNGAKIQMRKMGDKFFVEIKLTRKDINEKLEFADWSDADRTFRKNINKLSHA